MIEASEIVDRIGRKKFVEMVTKSQGRGEKYGDIERRRSRGRIKHRFCEHGKQTIKDWEPYETCEKCYGGAVMMVDTFVPHFNVALGGFIEDKSDFKKQVKRAEKQGWHHIGSDKI